MQFQVPKSFDEIKEAVLAPEGVYKFIVTKVESMPNKAGTGNNIVIDLTLTGDTEDHNGIIQTIYLPLPNPLDEGRTTRAGQSMVDWKLQNIKDNVEALGGEIKGDTFDIPDNAMCKANLSIQMNAESGNKFNRIDGRIMSYKAGSKQAS